MRYGGQTPCASVRTPEGELVVIDAGTGLRVLGERLIGSLASSPLRMHLLMTHFHLDHIIGLPLFSPIFSEKTTMTIYTDAPEAEARSHLEGIMAGRYFPVGLNEAAADIRIRRMPEEGLHLGGVEISTCPLIHPQESVAYRLKSEEVCLVYATDTEHPESGRLDDRLARFCRDADVLVYDGMYTPEEYSARRRGWGHSTWEVGVRMAREAGVKKLYLSHFSPNYDDDRLDGIVEAARRRFPQTYGAREVGTRPENPAAPGRA